MSKDLKKVRDKVRDMFKGRKELKQKLRNLIKVILLVLCVFFLFLQFVVPMFLKETDKSHIDAESAMVKPIIYLYPTTETQVKVKVGCPQKLTHTYPKYKEKGWNVIAQPNGDLVDVETGKSLYCLYWEGISTSEIDLSKGFVVEGRDTIPFLENKLALLGLNEREANEFIIYWLPKMENNSYNWIYFKTNEEMDKEMPLQITPIPNQIIRVFMEFKPLEQPTKVKEQQIVTPERKGFTVVEWGGTER